MALKRYAPLIIIIIAAVGAFVVPGCGSSTSPSSTVADLTVTSTVVNRHSHTVNVPSSDQLHPADMTLHDVVYARSHPHGDADGQPARLYCVGRHRDGDVERERRDGDPHARLHVPREEVRRASF